jgi:CBS domain-containing protein
MSETTASELARLVAELADRMHEVTGDMATGRLAGRARTLAGGLRPSDPARLALRQQTVTVEVDVPARVVVETLANERTGAVLVVAGDGPIGIVAERDIVQAIAANRPFDDLDAGDLVSPDLVSATATDTIAEVAALIAAHRVRHIPLIDGRTIIGVVSALDLAGALAGGNGPSH